MKSRILIIATFFIISASCKSLRNNQQSSVKEFDPSKGLCFSSLGLTSAGLGFAVVLTNATGSCAAGAGLVSIATLGAGSVTFGACALPLAGAIGAGGIAIGASQVARLTCGETIYDIQISAAATLRNLTKYSPGADVSQFTNAPVNPPAVPAPTPIPNNAQTRILNFEELPVDHSAGVSAASVPQLETNEIKNQSGPKCKLLYTLRVFPNSQLICTRPGSGQLLSSYVISGQGGAISPPFPCALGLQQNGALADSPIIQGACATLYAISRGIATSKCIGDLSAAQLACGGSGGQYIPGQIENQSCDPGQVDNLSGKTHATPIHPLYNTGPINSTQHNCSLISAP